MKKKDTMWTWGIFLAAVFMLFVIIVFIFGAVYLIANIPEVLALIILIPIFIIGIMVSYHSYLQDQNVKDVRLREGRVRKQGLNPMPESKRPRVKVVGQGGTTK